MKSWLASGCVLGLAVGFVLGGLGMSLVQHDPLHAVATDSAEGFTIATGAVTGDAEAVFTLDHLTGQLSAYVYNAAARGFTPQGIYQKNVTEDLKLETGKAPKFLMVTGGGDIKGQGQVQFAPTLVYIAEVNSGNMVVYGLTASRNAQPTFTLIYTGSIRNPMRTP